MGQAAGQPAAPATEKAVEPADPAKPKGDDRVGETAKEIAVQPLKDLNIKQDKIPPELLAILDAPYDISGLKTCPALRGEVARLTSVLGPDVDSAEVGRKKGKQSASEFVLDGAKMAAGSLIPFSGLIRKVSGAEAAERRTQAAILAGHIRRAYIKGNLRARNCR
ncbi:hypothetical protein IP88_07545 [alpha proteobacterium AAP81b]|nr:hypothetical protein IP88_07545 [alpha proteobacterium AAP81b]